MNKIIAMAKEAGVDDVGKVVWGGTTADLSRFRDLVLEEAASKIDTMHGGLTSDSYSDAIRAIKGVKP